MITNGICKTKSGMKKRPIRPGSTHIDIFALFITYQKFHNEVFGPRRDGLLADELDELADLQLHPLLCLQSIIRVAH